MSTGVTAIRRQQRLRHRLHAARSAGSRPVSIGNIGPHLGNPASVTASCSTRIGLMPSRQSSSGIAGADGFRFVVLLCLSSDSSCIEPRGPTQTEPEVKPVKAEIAQMHNGRALANAADQQVAVDNLYKFAEVRVDLRVFHHGGVFDRGNAAFVTELATFRASGSWRT